MKFKTSIQRGKSQVLFNDLPGALIDFPTADIVCKVVAWQSSEIKENSNKRILDKIYTLMPHRFPMGVDTRYPKKSDITQFMFGEPISVECEIFPLAFKANNTKRVYFFYSVDHLDNFLSTWDKPEGLTQIDLVFIDKFGDVDRLHPTKDVKTRDIILNKLGKSQAGYYWFDAKTGENLGQIYHFMRNKRINVATPVRAKITYLPQIITLVNIRDFLDLGQKEKDILIKTIVSRYLGHLDEYNEMTFEQIVREVSHDKGVSISETEKLLNLLRIDKNSLPENTKREIEKISKSSTSVGTKIKSILENDNTFTECLDLPKIYDEIYEYLTTIESKNKISLDDIISSSSGKEKDKFIQFEKRMNLIGVKKVTFVEDIPIQNIAYGYVRGSFDTKETILRAFSSDKLDIKKRIPIYVNNTITEGLILELDRSKILKWLNENNIVKTGDMSVEEEKIWFLKNIDTSKITTFSGTLESGITSEVFKLIHSMSHALIKRIPELSGLGADSIGEILFPNIPAILIFSKEGGDFRIGALSDLFYNKLYPWVDVTVKDIGKCVYDPVCYHDTGSCHSCLFLNEISCSNFNQDLSRHYLIGKKMSSFWGDAIFQLDTGDF